MGSEMCIRDSPQVDLVTATAGVERLVHVRTMHLGPEEVLLGMKIAVAPGTTVEQVATLVDAIEVKLRAELPGILAWAVGTIFQRIVICQLLQESAVSTLWAAIFHMMANLAWQAFPVHGSYWDPFYFAPLTVAIAALLFVIKQQTSWLA